MKMTTIVLAAGMARRFGAPKQLLALGSTTLLGQVLDNVRRSESHRIVVVLGRAADAIEAHIDLNGVDVVRNPTFDRGCGGSIRVGAAAVDEESDGVTLVLGDQPGVSPAILNAAGRAFSNQPCWGQLTKYSDGIGHPFIFGRSALPELLALKGDKALWKRIEAERNRIRLWPWPHPIPPDVDRPEDYARLLRTWTTEGP